MGKDSSSPCRGSRALHCTPRAPRWRLAMQQCFLPQRLPASSLFHIKSEVSRTHQVPQDPQQSHVDSLQHSSTDRDPSPPSLGSIPLAPSHLSSRTQLCLDTGNGFLREHSVSPKAHEWLFLCQCLNNALQGSPPNPLVQDPHPCSRVLGQGLELLPAAAARVCTRKILHGLTQINLSCLNLTFVR